MAEQCVLALDIGTSSTRALLFSQETTVTGAEVHLDYERTLRADGTAEVDPSHLLNVVALSVDEVLRQNPTQARNIAAVGISTFWHGLLAADEWGSPATPLYLWSDSRSWPQADELERELDSEAVRQRTGCAIHPSYWPSKLKWLRSEQPELWRRPTRWLSFGDFLSQRLTGVLGTSISMASGTGLLRLREMDWDPPLLNILELEPEQLPPLAERMQPLSGEFAARWPQLTQVPWVMPAGDGALASLGSGCLDESSRALTIGTSGALRVLSRKLPDRLPEGLFCYRLDQTTLVAGAASSNGGNLHEWLARSLRVDPDSLEEQVAAMRPGEHGLAFLPLLAGERSLGFAAHATGAIAGLTLATTPAEIVRAGLEAIAVEFALYDRRLDEAWPQAESMVASGAGLLKSPAWMQMIADALGRPVHASAAKEASSRGAAIRALEAAGLWQEPYARVGVTSVFSPDEAAGEVYRRAARVQELLYEFVVRGGLFEAGARSAHYVHGRQITN